LSFAFGSFLNAHVLEFARFEYFSALQAFHKFSVFVAAHNLNTRMLARLVGVLRMRERLGGHKSGSVALTEVIGDGPAGISGILAPLYHLSSASLLNVRKLEDPLHTLGSAASPFVAFGNPTKIIANF
jgi:hypothetical protein